MLYCTSCTDSGFISVCFSHPLSQVYNHGGVIWIEVQMRMVLPMNFGMLPGCMVRKRWVLHRHCPPRKFCSECSFLKVGWLYTKLRTHRMQWHTDTAWSQTCALPRLFYLLWRPHVLLSCRVSMAYMRDKDSEIYPVRKSHLAYTGKKVKCIIFKEYTLSCRSFLP